MKRFRSAMLVACMLATGACLTHMTSQAQAVADAPGSTTSPSPTEHRRQWLAHAPLADAIKTVHGNGKRVLYVFSDPDCSYCQRFEHTLKTIDNVTIYTFLYPLEALHPHAVERATAIWCAADKQAAWQGWMLERQPPGTATCAAPIARNQALGRQLGVRGTPTLMTPDGRMLAGAYPADAIEQFLSQRP